MHARQARLPIFDAHVHYSHDAVELVPPKQAVQILRQAGLKGVFVSSSDDDGTQKLLAEAPDLIVPELRPYRTRADVSGWVRDERHRALPRAAAGASTATPASASSTSTAPTPTCRCRSAWSRWRASATCCCTRTATSTRSSGCSRAWPQARILWAHSGFERPAAVREMLRKHPQLWCDLAYRTDQASNNEVDAAWREAFVEFPDRFMVGTDTFTPERWHYIVPHADFSRGWLADLPPPLAERIAWRNAETLLRGAWQKKA